MKINAFVPIKNFNTSKDRLKNILSPSQRSELSMKMAHQTINTLKKSGICNSITLVTNDPKLSMDGTSIFFTNSSLNSALHEAIETFDINKTDDLILIMHADLPKIHEMDLQSLVDTHDQSAISIVSDIDCTGTNCLLYSVNMKFNLQFGLNSFSLFTSEFQRNNFRWNNIAIKTLQQDLDSEDDYFKLKDYIRD